MTVQNITIGGREFPIPLLSLGQLKIVAPALMRLNAMKQDAFTEENITDLSEIAYVAICRSNPTFPRAEFFSLPGTVEELLISKVIIAQQCGMKLKTDDEPGEAPAGISTGTKS